MCDLVSYGARTMDTMPQTVPSAGFTPPCDYSNFAADCFDLSLLPSPDGEVPYSPVSLQQVMSFYSDPTTSPPSMFPAGGPDDYHAHLKPTTAAGSSGAAPAGSPVTTMAAQVQCSTDPYHFPLPATATIKEEPVHYHSRDAACSYMPSPYSSGGPMSASPMPSSPAGSTSSSASYQRSVSPVVKPEQSLDLQEILQESRYLRESLKQKQERGPLSCAEDASGKLAPPPPHPFAGLQVPKKEQEPVAGPSSAPEPCAGPGPGPSSAADHRLLREVLRDTSFQRRYNLKPFDFAGLAPGFMASEAGPSARPSLAGPPPHAHAHPADASPPPPPPAHAHAHAHAPEVKLEEGEALQLSRERMEPVLSLAIEQLRKDVGDTCTVLGISPDPTRWAASDVRAWLLWTLRQYALPMIPIEYFDMDGPALAALSEHDFHQRAPQCGSTLYAQLEIWKAACQDLDIQWTNSSTSSSSTGDEPSDDEEDMEAEASPAGAGAGGAGAAPGGSGASGATGAAGAAGAAGAGASAAVPGGGKAPSSRATGSAAGGAGGGASGGSGGSHIHLWQFLKELLAAPQLHGSCIRWLDRSKGVFKIEDSVRVARLWGKRKNRPAMNYDKLSRSIRQYYKKGIMKKTERSQRLVYQFCHPYSL